MGASNLLPIKKLFYIFLFILIALSGTGNPVHAGQEDKSVLENLKQPDAPDASTDENKDNNIQEETITTSTDLSIWDFLRVFVATIFVVALLYFMLKFISKKNKAYQKANFIENLGGTSLGANRSIQIIKVGESILIVGVGENIQLLKDIEDPVQYQKLLEEYNERLESTIQPMDIISKLGNKLTKAEPSKEGFSSQLKKQLDALAKSRNKGLDELDRKDRDNE